MAVKCTLYIVDVQVQAWTGVRGHPGFCIAPTGVFLKPRFGIILSTGPCARCYRARRGGMFMRRKEVKDYARPLPSSWHMPVWRVELRSARNGQIVSSTKIITDAKIAAAGRLHLDRDC